MTLFHCYPFLWLLFGNKGKKRVTYDQHLFGLLFFNRHFKLSSKSVVFTLSASLSDCTPVASIKFPVCLCMKNLMQFYKCSLCIVGVPLRLSAVSVVFIINDLLNDIAPFSSMLLSLLQHTQKQMNIILAVLFLILTHNPD